MAEIGTDATPGGDAFSLDRAGRHVPGSGIDFAVVGQLYVLERSDVTEPLWDLTPDGELPRLEPEQFVAVPVIAQVGDVVVAVRHASDVFEVSRPWQVRSRGVAADDTSLADWVRVDDDLGDTLLSGSHGRASVWAVLAAWSITRCPRCHAPGLRVAGGLSGPPEPGWAVGTCVALPAFDGDTVCSRCDTYWTAGPLASDDWC